MSEGLGFGFTVTKELNQWDSVLLEKNERGRRGQAPCLLSSQSSWLASPSLSLLRHQDDAEADKRTQVNNSSTI